MTRTSTVVWRLIGLVIAVLVVLGLIYGPGFYREAKALVGPLIEVAQSEDRLTTLNIEMPFEEPTDGSVTEARFGAFLDIRRELLPGYREWQAVERKLDQQGEEDWEFAKEVLVAIQAVMALQVETLKAHGMSPSEFSWIEDLAYVTWTESVADLVEASTVTERLIETTTADMGFLADLERRHGSSRATRQFATHLNERLQSLDNPGPPTVEGVSDATSSLFWAHREELDDLDLAAYSELHGVLRGNDVDIKIDGE